MLKPQLPRLTKNLALLGLLPIFFTACRDSGVTELKPNEIADLNKPGTVMIQATHQAEITVPDYQVDEGKLEAWLSQNRSSLAQVGSEAKILALIIQEVFTNPLEYLAPSNEIIRKNPEATSQGSGFIVSDNGYVVTNAHVVSSEGDELKRELATSALREIAIANCKEFMAELGSDGQEMLAQTIGTQELIELCLSGSLDYYAEYLEIGDVERSVKAIVAPASPQVEQKTYISDVKAEGKPAPGKDVAVLKIDADNLPTVQLGDAEAITTGDPTFVLGYPAGADIGDKPEPSLTSGLISAEKTMPDGWEVFQTNAAISPGNSGGPVFNKQGDAVAVATFGSVDPQTGQKIEGINFAIPSDIIKEYLSQANVEPQTGRLTELYREGIKLMGQQRYRSALSKFEEIEDLNPEFPYIQQKITQVRKDLIDHPESHLPWIVGGGAGIAGLAAVGFWLVRRSRKPPAVSTPQPEVALSHEKV
ncbi:MAG: serine protease [Elainella sp. Prado103]|jgi:S1-C subfamily serine protease|nr:serine protease [Elainella sp. Prado103]